MSDEAYRFLLRMPHALRDGLRTAAAANGRSLNAEIVARLEETSASGAAPRVRARTAAAVIVAAALGASLVGVTAGSRLALQQSHSVYTERSVVAVEPGLKRMLVVEPVVGS